MLVAPRPSRTSMRLEGTMARTNTIFNHKKYPWKKMRAEAVKIIKSKR
jgi:hypothetical protein